MPQPDSANGTYEDLHKEVTLRIRILEEKFEMLLGMLAERIRERTKSLESDTETSLPKKPGPLQHPRSGGVELRLLRGEDGEKDDTTR